MNVAANAKASTETSRRGVNRGPRNALMVVDALIVSAESNLTRAILETCVAQDSRHAGPREESLNEPY